MTARNSNSRSTHRESTHHETHASGTFRVSVRRVLTRPDARLTVRAAEVDPCDLNAVALADVLVGTMRTSPACVGLAATQVGEAVRIFCMDVTGHPKARSCAGLVVLCNPKIVSASADVVLREGCMSVPEWTGNVARAKEVTVEGYEPGSGRVLCVSADGIEARCLQHEIDHLDGLVFVDRVNDAATDLFPRKTYA
jgi:peptide deformylase